MKTYLKDLTPEEIIRKLKAGEVVKNETSNARIVEGMVCLFRNEKLFAIGAFGVETDDYFETTDELELEVGKFYRTRDGKKVVIIGIDYSREDYPFWGGVIGNCFSSSWASNGRFDLKRETKTDLISEWRDDEEKEND